MGSANPAPAADGWRRTLRGISVGRLPCRSDEHREKRSDAMHILEHLFLVGEFPARAHLLSGLTLEQVTQCPDGASHSIYDELWHVVAYQQSIIEPGDPAGDVYPSAAPEHERQWHDLVRVFLDGAHAAAALGQAPERLALEVEPGVTMADELYSVAVHNAYHLGKIVALRQRIGSWPPTAAADES
jgi:uncharacterized damage-inducible protein DinB